MSTIKDKKLIIESILRSYSEVVMEPKPDENVSHTLKQLGLLLEIFLLSLENEIVTSAMLCKKIKADRGLVKKWLDALEEKGVIERKTILNKIGRGRAHQIIIKHSPQIIKLSKEILDN